MLTDHDMTSSGADFVQLSDACSALLRLVSDPSACGQTSDQSAFFGPTSEQLSQSHIRVQLEAHLTAMSRHLGHLAVACDVDLQRATAAHLREDRMLLEAHGGACTTGDSFTVLTSLLTAPPLTFSTSSSHRRQHAADAQSPTAAAAHFAMLRRQPLQLDRDGSPLRIPSAPSDGMDGIFLSDRVPGVSDDIASASGGAIGVSFDGASVRPDPSSDGNTSSANALSPAAVLQPDDSCSPISGACAEADGTYGGCAGGGGLFSRHTSNVGAIVAHRRFNAFPESTRTTARPASLPALPTWERGHRPHTEPSQPDHQGDDSVTAPLPTSAVTSDKRNKKDCKSRESDKAPRWFGLELLRAAKNVRDELARAKPQ